MMPLAVDQKLGSQRPITAAGGTTATVRNDGNSSFSYLSIDVSCC